jgi:hypothetical protein
VADRRGLLRFRPDRQAQTSSSASIFDIDERLGLSARRRRASSITQQPTSKPKESPMRRIALVLAAAIAAANAAFAAVNPATACLGPVAPHLAHLAASGLPSETLEGEPMARALDLLRERVDFDEAPTRIVVALGEHRAAVWLIVDEQLCNIIHGPAEGVRAILRRARGEGV